MLDQKTLLDICSDGYFVVEFPMRSPMYLDAPYDQHLNPIHIIWRICELFYTRYRLWFSCSLYGYPFHDCSCFRL